MAHFSYPQILGKIRGGAGAVVFADSYTLLQQRQLGAEAKRFNRSYCQIFLKMFLTLCLQLRPHMNTFKGCSQHLRLLFSLKPKEMAKMRLLAIWIDQRQSFKSEKKIL